MFIMLLIHSRKPEQRQFVAEVLGEATGDKGHIPAQEVSDHLFKHKMNAQLLLPTPASSQNKTWPWSWHSPQTWLFWVQEAKHKWLDECYPHIWTHTGHKADHHGVHTSSWRDHFYRKNFPYSLKTPMYSLSHQRLSYVLEQLGLVKAVPGQGVGLAGLECPFQPKPFHVWQAVGAPSAPEEQGCHRDPNHICGPSSSRLVPAPWAPIM